MTHQQSTQAAQQNGRVTANRNGVTWPNASVPAAESIQTEPTSCHIIPLCQGLSSSQNLWSPLRSLYHHQKEPSRNAYKGWHRVARQRPSLKWPAMSRTHCTSCSKQCWTIPPYSPDVSHFDVFLKNLEGHSRLESDEDVRAAEMKFQEQPREYFFKEIHRLECQWNACL